MSGVDERPDFIPKCKCGNFKTWVIQERLLTGTTTLLWFNVDDYRSHRYGRWHFVYSKNATMMRRMSSMCCDECDAIASSEDFAKVLELFREEHSGMV